MCIIYTHTYIHVNLEAEVGESTTIRRFLIFLVGGNAAIGGTCYVIFNFVILPPFPLVTHGLLSSPLSLGFCTHPATPLAALRWAPPIGRALPGGPPSHFWAHQFAYTATPARVSGWHVAGSHRATPPPIADQETVGPPYHCANAGGLFFNFILGYFDYCSPLV